MIDLVIKDGGKGMRVKPWWWEDVGAPLTFK